VKRSRKSAIWLIASVIGVGAIAVVEVPRIGKVKSTTGAVLIADIDPRKQVPLGGVDIAGEVGGVTVRTRSGATGFFRLTWPRAMWRGQQLTLQFRDDGYQPLAVKETFGPELTVAHLAPSRPAAAPPGGSETTLANLRIRYSMKGTNTIDVGSTEKTFEVVNTANVACRRHPACSPDGRWAAALGSFQLDAGAGQEFQSARVSCVAGPCPFTRIETDNFSRGGRVISGTLLAWSDTATFLVEAEVMRTALSDMIRQSYPSIYGRTMTFTVPLGGEGPSIQADVNGTTIVFPLGPALILTWASCSLQVTADQSKLYSCTLKPGYRFR